MACLKQAFSKAVWRSIRGIWVALRLKVNSELKKFIGKTKLQLLTLIFIYKTFIGIPCFIVLHRYGVFLQIEGKDPPSAKRLRLTRNDQRKVRIF